MIRLIVEGVTSAPGESYNKVPPSIVVRGENRGFVYLQYKFDCVNKDKNTYDLVNYLSGFVDVPMKVSEGRFSPGIETIRSYGDWWIDGAGHSL